MPKGDFFQILKRDGKTNARVGEIKTLHGKIKTPAFVPVGTQGSVKSLDNRDLCEIGVQIFFLNTYHLYLRPGEEVIKNLGGVHKFTNWHRPLMTDSGGFQIFSLACKKEGKKLVEVEDKGVTFFSHLDGSKHFFTPEKAIKIQKKLGADIILVLDECASYPVSKSYARRAMERTHSWALRSLSQIEKRDRQKVFGIVQGGVFKDLREQSAKFISRLAFDGLAIGGVSVGEGKKKIRQVTSWVVPFLPEEKPRHLLGVGDIDDIFEAVEKGIDTLDCVMPTRLARTGKVLVKERQRNSFWIDISKSSFIDDSRSIDKNCSCFTCRSGFSRAYLCHLFRARELLAYRLATIHNLHFVMDLMRKIREAITKGEFDKLKEDWNG